MSEAREQEGRVVTCKTGKKRSKAVVEGSKAVVQGRKQPITWIEGDSTPLEVMDLSNEPTEDSFRKIQHISQVELKDIQYELWDLCMFYDSYLDNSQ